MMGLGAHRLMPKRACDQNPVGDDYCYRLLSFAMELTLSSAALDQRYGSWIRSEGGAVGFSQRELLEFVMFDPSPQISTDLLPL
jgi:hypothetical protein